MVQRRAEGGERRLAFADRPFEQAPLLRFELVQQRLADPVHETQARPDRRQEVVEIHRLDQIIVRTRPLAVQDLAAVGQRGQEDERHLGEIGPARAQPFHELVAADLRHGDVAQDEVRPHAGNESQRLAPVGGLDDGVAGAGELLHDVAAQIDLVLDAQDRRHAVRLRSFRPHAAAAPSRGRLTTKVEPPPSRGRASTSPP